MEHFPKYISVSVSVTSVDGPEALIVRKANQTEPFVSYLSIDLALVPGLFFTKFKSLLSLKGIKNHVRMNSGCKRFYYIGGFK